MKIHHEIADSSRTAWKKLEEHGSKWLCPNFERRSSHSHHSHGFQWFPMVSNGFPWFPMVSHGFQWFPMVSNGVQWFPMVSNGFPWFPMVSHGFQWFPMVSNGFQWFPMVSNGFQWFPMVSNGFRWFPMIINHRILGIFHAFPMSFSPWPGPKLIAGGDLFPCGLEQLEQ